VDSAGSEDGLCDITISSDVWEDFMTSGDFTDTVRGGGGGLVPEGDLGPVPGRRVGDISSSLEAGCGWCPLSLVEVGSGKVRSEMNGISPTLTIGGVSTLRASGSGDIRGEV